MRVDPTREMYKFLRDSGVLGQWTDSNGNVQDAPCVQRDKLIETEAADNQRILLIKNMGGSGDRSSSQPAITFAVLGKVNNNDLPLAKEYAYLIYDKLLEFECADYIVSIEPLTGVNGSYTMASGRDVFDMEFLVNVETGVILT